jgi:hypothetical protein
MVRRDRYSEEIVSQAVTALYGEFAGKTDRHGGLRRCALSEPSTSRSGSRRPSDAGPIRQALCEDEQERLHRCGSDRRGRGAAEDALCADVPIKSDDQLDMQSLHRVRDRWVRRRTSLINQIRSLLLERGITIRHGRRHAEAALPGILEDPDTPLSGRLRTLLAQLQREWRQLQSQIEEIDEAIVRAAGEHEACQRLMTIPGVGFITATAVIAAIGTGAESERAEVTLHGWG